MRSILTICLTVLCFVVHAQVFQQDFSASTVLSDYINTANPSTGQFTAIGTSGGGTVISIAGGTLQFVRSGNAGGFTRNVDFSPVPDIMSVKFDLNVPDVTGIATGGMTVYIGDGFANGTTTAPANSSVHSRFAVSFTSTASDQYKVREVGGSDGATALSGLTSITWVINNTGNNGTYTAPDGSTEQISNDTWDLWVGTTKEFNNRPATTGTIALAELKMIWNNGAGTVQFDNFLIESLASFLPVSLLSFDAMPDARSVQIEFSTASERNCDYFAVERSDNGATFSEIGRLKGAGDAVSTQHYHFTDLEPLPGLAYYRLRQVDFDGQTTYSPVVTARFGAQNRLQLSPVPAAATLTITLDEAMPADGTWLVFDLIGNLLLSGNIPAESTIQRLDVENLPEGNYVVRVCAGQWERTALFNKH